MEYHLKNGQTQRPKTLLLQCRDTANELAAALTGSVAAYIPEHLCRIHLQNGELLELFPEIPRRPWQLYIYRLQRTVTSGRVLKVFDWLTEMLREMYGKEAT